MGKTNNKQCEFARVMTGSFAPDQQIIDELSGKTEPEWDAICNEISNMMSRHDQKNEKYPLDVWSEFRIVGEENGVDAATMLLAYAAWCESK